MKRIYYLCLLLLINMNVFAQIDLTDHNWKLCINDNFISAGRGWNTSTFEEIADTIVWVCKAQEYQSCPVISGHEHKSHIYQPSQCVFSNNTLNLVALYKGSDLSCAQGDYIVPTGTNCIDCSDANRKYFSGIIQTKEQFGYGYFEIRCKLPIHEGVHTCFWLLGNGSSSYEEIDIVEYSRSCSDNYSPRKYSSVIHHNPDSCNYSGSNPYGHVIYTIPENEPDVNQYHTYGCEWMPEYVKWYRDGNLVAEYRDRDHIPQYKKRVIVNYTIDKHNGIDPQWYGTATMTIDYIKVYQMKTDCNTDVLITNGSQITNFDERMKNSVTIGNSGTSISFPSNTHVSMHAAEHITLNGEIIIPSGTQLTLSTHECPETAN